MDDLTDIPHIASPLLYLFNGELVRISAFIKENKGTIAYGNLYGLRTHSESPVVHFSTLKTKPKQDRILHIAKESSNDYSLDLVGEWYSCEYMPFTLREFLQTRLFQLAESETKFVVMVSKKESTTDTDPLCLGTFFLVAKAGVICKVDRKILNRESPFRFIANLATELESIEYQSTDDHDQANIEEGKHNGFGQKLNREIREFGRTRETYTSIKKMTLLEQASSNGLTDIGQHCTGGLEEVKVKVNDGTNDGNTNLSNGLDANLSTQHVPESQYGSPNDQNTSNFDNGSGTEKIEGKEDDKAEDMISNNLQTQTDTINGTQTRQSSDFQEKNEDECPNKDDEDGEDRETSETHGGSETEQEPRDVNSGTHQKSKPNGMETEVETSDCPSERTSVPQSTGDNEKIGTTSSGISSPCDDAKDASKDVARNECQPKDETDKQTAETQKGFETRRSAPNINRETEEPKLTSTEVRAKPVEENLLGQSLKKDQRSESAKLDGLAAADNSGETHSDGKDHDDSTVSSHEAEGDQSNARTTSTLSQTNGQPKIVKEDYDKLAKMIIEKIEETPSIPVDCKNVGSRKVEITLEFQFTAEYQLTCEKKTEQEPRDVNGGTRQKIKPNGIGTEVETPDCPSEKTSVPQSTGDNEKIGTTSNGTSSPCDDAKDASKDVARNECQPKDETDKQTTETQKGFETDRSAPNINCETEEPKPTSTEVRAEPMEENVLGQPLKKDQRSESPKLDDPVAADNSGETPSDDEDHDDSTASSHETEGDQSNDPDIENFPADPLSQTNGQPIIANEEYDKLTKVIIEKIEETPSIPFGCKNVGRRNVEITLEFQSTGYQLTCERKGETFRKTTVILKVGPEQLVETEMNDSIEEIAKFAADKILQHNNIK